MKRFWAVLVGVVAVAGSASAEPIKPAVEVRVKAAKELVPILEYAGALFGQEDAGKQFAALLDQFAKNEGGYEGIDLTRPIGAYVGVAETVEDSPVVVLVPVADEKAVLALLAEKLMYDPKKGDGGAYSVDVPGVPGPVHFRFADKYAYVTIRTAKGIDPKRLIAPKDFFPAKPDTFASAVVHLDRWPKDIKTNLTIQLEYQLAENNKALIATPVQKLFNDFLADVSVDAAKAVLTDGERLAVSLDVDPKADDWKFAAALTAKPGTPLDKTLAGFADRESVAAGAAWVANPLSNSGVNFRLPPETTKKFAAVLDAAAKQAVDDAKEGDRIGMKLFLDAVLPTVKGGDFQLGALATPPAKEGGKLGGMVAVKTVGGKQIEAAAKLAAVAIPKEAGGLEGDADSVGERKLHKLTLKNQDANPFAAGTLWAMTSDDLLAVSADPKADPLKAVAAAKPTKTPMFFTEISLARVAPFLEKERKPEDTRKVVADVFGAGKVDGRDTLKVVLSGGKKLELAVTMKGKAVALMAALDRAKKGE